MATHLEILTLNHNRIQQTNDENNQQNPTVASWMWNPKRSRIHNENEYDSWEVKAFEQDTKNNIMGTTWPPRSYPCTFCRREFRSAQALGGHMNVHRRDRARLHQTNLPIISPTNSIGPSSSSSIINPNHFVNPNHFEPNNSSTVVIPSPDFATNGGLCLFYQLPNHDRVFGNTNSIDNSNPSTLLSISPYPHHNSMNSTHFYGKSLESSSGCDGNVTNDCYEDSGELDLELRLGHSSTTQ